MVRQFGLIFFCSNLVFLSGVAQAAMRLSQKDVAELVLRQGQDTQEVNLNFLKTRLIPATLGKDYDWNITAETGYEFDKSETFNPSVLTGSSYKRLRSSLALTKTVAATGSILGIGYNRLSQRVAYDFVGPDTPTGPSALTQDILDVTFEQPLLNNFFGRADRAKLRSAGRTFSSGAIQRADQLEDVVLKSIRAFWDAYVAKETFRESLASRERYKGLVGKVRRKSGYGYANPAELSQVQAELEVQEQNVKTSSTDYLLKVENLCTLLNLPAQTEIEFEIAEEVPQVPKLSPVEVERLRAIRGQNLLVEAAGDSLTASKSLSYPAVNLVGKLYSSGFDESAGTSFSSATSGSHPKYYAGVKVVYNFGSNYQNEEILNRKTTEDLERTRLERRKLERITALNQAERSVQSTYGVIQSAVKQKQFREKAVQELTRSYGQGRTDIKTLIDAINNQFGTETTLSRAIGNYQIALNEWAAARDELVPEGKEGEK